MKKSKYNIVIKNKNEYILYNSFSKSILALNKKEYFKNFKKFNIKNEGEIEKELYNNGFFIDDSLNELNVIKSNYFQSQYNNDILTITVCPTLDCNFACPYCFESRDKHIMTIEQQNKLIEFIKSFKGKIALLGITWFGGEPLLCWDMIESMSKELIKFTTENDIEYHAYMISNGYLLNDYICSKLTEYKIDGIQITIDGPPEVHNKRRILKNGGPTFNKIVSNLKLLSKYNINTCIRINIDKTNIEDAQDTLSIIQNLKLKNLTIDFGHILNYTNICNSIACNCLTKKNYSNLVFKICNDKKNNQLFKKQDPPNSSLIYCGSVRKLSYDFDSHLNIYKCLNDIGNITKSIGNIENSNTSINNQLILNEYLLWNPFDFKKCLRCKYLPICIGGCPYMGLKHHKPVCEKWKYIITKQILENEKANDCK